MNDWHGLLVLDKPQNVTSRDVVNRVQAQLPRKVKIGHTGTLDPLATGVLVLCIGHATRLVEIIQELPKTYRTRICLGASSNTDDADGVVTERAATPVALEYLQAALRGFLGEITQLPPAYSAAHVGGQRAYARARRGEAVQLIPRTVRIDRLDILAFEWPFLDLEVHCGKGTYIRSIARDLGERLHCGGYVATLRRTAIGTFLPELALPEATEISPRLLLPLTYAVAHLPQVTLNEEQITRIGQGQSLRLPNLGLADNSEIALLDVSGKLIALAKLTTDGLLQPTRVLQAIS